MKYIISLAVITLIWLTCTIAYMWGFAEGLEDNIKENILELNVDEAHCKYLRIKWQAGGWNNWDSWHFTLDELRILGRNNLNKLREE